MGQSPLRRAIALRPAPEVFINEGRELSQTGRIMQMFGLGSDLVLLIAVLVGWFLLMRFVLPRLGVST